MLRLALAIFALIVVAYAQNTTAGACDFAIACSKELGACGTNVNLQASGQSFTADLVSCSTGTHCTGGACAQSARLGQACSATNPCWDADYTGVQCDFSASSPTCKYTNIYGPGESCSSDTTNYLNGGCVTGQTCTSSGSCSSNPAGSNPNITVGTNANAYCAPKTYFNGTTCVSQLSSGATCAGDYQCSAGLVCSNHGSGGYTCQSPFTQATGAGCVSVFDCQANLRCLSGKCTAIPKTGESCIDASDSSDTDSSVCTTNGDAGVGCVCGTSHASAKDSNGRSVAIEYPNGKATCEDGLEHFSSSEQTAWTDTQSCLQNAGCNDLHKLAAAGVSLSGPSQCVANCLHSAYPTGFEKNGLSYNTCPFNGASAVILPSVVAIIALILVALL